jgi:Ser/Thr protein kinase RdoA (MazF antagonist)
MQEQILKNRVEQFDLQGTVTSVKPLGAGHINDSYKVTTDGNAPDYVLQRINHYIFKDVDALQNNIRRVTDHIRAKHTAAGVSDVENRVLRLAPAKDGKLYHRDAEGNYWRILYFIPDSHSYDEGITPELAMYAGRAFGDFQAMLADLPGAPLVETIPNFHNMETRLATFRQAVKDDKAGRLAKTQYMVDEVEKRADEMCKAERLHREGVLPKRINHCDTKVNNVLFDANNQVLCVVDLDTVMPGYVLSDFGDFMRTGANTGKEDDTNLDMISIDMKIFEAYTRGYLEKAKSFLLPVEIDHLAFGAQLLTYMQTVRFFADYLDGALYYKIHSPEQKWQRTVAQFKLLQSMEENFDEMRRIVAEAAK